MKVRSSLATMYAVLQFEYAAVLCFSHFSPLCVMVVCNCWHVGTSTVCFISCFTPAAGVNDNVIFLETVNYVPLATGVELC